MGPRRRLLQAISQLLDAERLPSSRSRDASLRYDSSRSHSIVTLTLREEDGASNTVRHVAEFLLVDLAGSERIGPPLPTLPTHTARAFR